MVKKDPIGSNREVRVEASTTLLTPEGITSHENISPLTESISSKSTALISTETSLGSNKRTWKEEEDRRKAVSSLYTEHIGVCEPSGWCGRDDTIAKIRTIYPDMSRSMIQNVLLDTLRAEKRREQYGGTRKERIFKGERLVSPQGLSEQVITDMIEDGIDTREQ